jgi:hypothetical protein
LHGAEPREPVGSPQQFPRFRDPMSLRRWFRDRILGDEDDSESDGLPPGSALVNTILGRETPPGRYLGDYDSTSYPADLRSLLRRREDVVRALLAMDIADPESRVSAIPALRALLREYPHPLVYDALINACIDAGRHDEAKGVAFALRQRRQECLQSPYPEIRAEVDAIQQWDPEEIEHLAAQNGSDG